MADFTSSSGSFIPNYPQSAFLQQIAAVAAQLEPGYFTWAQNQFNNNQKIDNQTVATDLATAVNAYNQGQQMWDRYLNVFQPIENMIVQQAKDYASPARIQMEMGRYGATAAQAGEKAREGALRDLESYGVDPSSGRFADLDRVSRMNTAASVASAENQGREATEAIQRGLQSEASQIGMRYPGQVVNAETNAISGAGAAINSALATTNTGVNAFGLPLAAINAAESLRYPPLGSASTSARGGGGGGSGNDTFMNSPAIWGPQPLGGYQPPSSTPNSPVVPGAPVSPGYYGPDFGGVAPPPDPGMLDMGASGDYSSGYAGGDFAGMDAAMADGGAPEDGVLPTTGGQVPYHASPSMGQQTDDVPARLNAGEFVIPRDVAAWKGHEFFQKLIQQSRHARGAAPAKPQMKPSQPMQPRFQSHAMSGGAI